MGDHRASGIRVRGAAEVVGQLGTTGRSGQLNTGPRNKCGEPGGDLQVVWTGNDMLNVGQCAEQSVAVEMVLTRGAKLMQVVRSDVGVLGCVTQRRGHGNVSTPARRSPNDPVVQVLTMHEGQFPYS
jgi:hypothetical protein